jgi:tetratricopeptide (TPR) repeat protein
LGDSPPEHLERARVLTGGHPRALEALYGVLEGDPETSLPTLLDQMEQLPADQDVVRYLLGRMLDRLDAVDRRVLQALAVFGRPVLPAAVDYLLQWYLNGYSSEPALRRLCRRRLIRQDGDRFYLSSSPDGELVLAGIPLGVGTDRDRTPPPLTRLALLHRAADYFKHVRRDTAERLDDLSPEFAEIDLRMRGQDHQAALRLITEIDQQYLTGWGQSDAVSPWRTQLVGKLSDPALEIHNLLWLAAARQQQEELHQAIELLTEVLDRSRDLRDRATQVRIQLQLGGAYVDLGEVATAAGWYERALRAAHRQRWLLEEAKARAGLVSMERPAPFRS